MNGIFSSFVLSEIPGHRETAGDQAWYFPPADARRLAETVAAALRSPDELRRRRASLRARAEGAFSLERMVKRVEELYDELLNREEAGRASRAGA